MINFITSTHGTGYFVIGLDADGLLNKDNLENALAAKYSFIADSQSISNLASAIASKDKTSIIRLSDDEVREALSGADINDEQLKIVINDLN